MYSFFRYALVIFLTASFMQFEKAVANHELHLEDAIAIALANNPSLLELEQRIEEAEGLVRQVRSRYYPNLRLDATLEGGDAPSMYLFRTIDAGRLAPNTDFNDPGGLTNFDYGLQMEMELFSWGRRKDKLAAACQGRNAVLFQRSDYINQLIAMIIAVYLDAFKARAAHDTAERSFDILTRQLEIDRKRLEQEAILRTDVLKLQVRQAEAEERMIRAHSAERQAMELLATLLGVEAGKNVIIADPSDYLNFEADSQEVGDFLRYPKTFSVWSAEAQVAMACRELQEVKKRKLPSVRVHGRTYLDSPDTPFRSKRANWWVGCTMSWDMYTGGRLTAEADVARASLKMAEQRLRREQLQVQEEIAVSQLKREEATQRLKVAQIGLQSAEESFKLVELQYQKGAASITSYLEAENMLASASYRLQSAVYDLYKAEADVLRSIGFLAGRS